MTEINLTKNGGEAPALKPSEIKGTVQGSADAERFALSGTQKTAPKQASAMTALEKGQDPLDKAAQAIEALISNSEPTTRLRIDKDDASGRFVYKSVDRESGEVVAQFPPETILEMISKFRDPEGLVVDNEA